MSLGLDQTGMRLFKSFVFFFMLFPCLLIGVGLFLPGPGWLMSSYLSQFYCLPLYTLFGKQLFLDHNLSPFGLFQIVPNGPVAVITILSFYLLMAYFFALLVQFLKNSDAS